MPRTLLHLPAELWLYILELAGTNGALQLWESARHVSRDFRDCVERLYTSRYLPDATITLALPRRDPSTGKLTWPGAPIPRANIVFAFDSIVDEKHVVFRSPASLGSEGDMQSVDELRRTGVLPEARLRAAPPWVQLGRCSVAGFSMEVPGRFGWDDERKMWVWTVRWRELLTRFCWVMNEARAKRNVLQHKGYR